MHNGVNNETRIGANLIVDLGAAIEKLC